MQYVVELSFHPGYHYHLTPIFKSSRPNIEQKRVNLDLPKWMIEKLDIEAKRIGVARQSIMKMFLAERLEM